MKRQAASSPAKPCSFWRSVAKLAAAELKVTRCVLPKIRDLKATNFVCDVESRETSMNSVWSKAESSSNNPLWCQLQSGVVGGISVMSALYCQLQVANRRDGVLDPSFVDWTPAGWLESDEFFFCHGKWIARSRETTSPSSGRITN